MGDVEALNRWIASWPNVPNDEDKLSVFLEHTIFIFVLTIQTKSGYFANELKVLQLARKENVPQIVSFFGAITNRRDAFMCMELLEGKERLIVAFFMHFGGYHLMLLKKMKQAELRRH